MDLLKKLTIKNLKLNKKRTIVTIIGIMLSVALITAVASMYNSCITSLVKYETYEKGDFHVVFYNVPIEETKTLKNNRKISEVFLTQDVGYANLENSKNEYKPYAFIKAFTKASLENLSVKLSEGRLPENEDEIVIPTHLKTNGRIALNVGDTITLNVGTRVSNGIELNQNDEFNKDSQEKIINTTSKTYKIVGIIERPASNIENYSAPGYTFITLLNDENILGKADAYCKYTKEGSKDYINVTANILSINEDDFGKFEKGKFDSEEEFNKIANEVSKSKYNYNINSYLIILETDPLNNNAVGGLGTVVIITCGIIVFTSVFCIKNSFDISIAEKTKQYGMLKSVGATKKQIRKNVFFEATILGLIGIPLGLLLGVFASSILILISNSFIGDMLAKGLKLVLSFSWISYAVAIGLGIITIYLSALRSARKASKISPIESIRNSNEIKIKSKKIKSPKIIKKLFGIGGEISYKNLKRNKKKYRTTVISITVSVFVFIALSYFMSLAFDQIKEELKLKDYNLWLLIDDNNDEQLEQKVIETTRLENIKNYTISKYDNCYITNSKYSDEYKEFMNGTSAKEEDIFDSNINVKTVNNEQYKEYIKKLGLNYEKMKNKAILINNIRVGKYDEEKNKYIQKNIKMFEYKENETINCKTSDDKQFDVEIGIITDILPFGLEEPSNYALMIVSNDIYEKYFKSNEIMIYYDSSNPDKLQDDIDELLKCYNYNINNIAENARMLEKVFTLVGIFLYGFIIVITLIGVTNIFNTITTNMELRKPEFAMLKSVGMTTKEFNKMIRLETVFMGIKSLLFSIPIGIGLSYLMYSALGTNQTLKFTIPIKSIIIAIVTVFLLITCIMKYSIGKIKKQNTIETIRNENI
ncbi:MAG: ABC transporter permease [Clostridia bacterium]